MENNNKEIKEVPFVEPIDEVIEIFNDYFGEDLVDVQKEDVSIYSIIIRFPVVQVTNEEGASEIITELYANIRVNKEGRFLGALQMMRSEFTEEQWDADYAHSHLPGIKLHWDNPCLGTGPIVGTIRSLRDRYNKEIWGLFCLELDKYVTIESLEGVPYRRISSIGSIGIRNDNVNLVFFELYYNEVIDKFIAHIAENMDIPIAYCDGRYIIGENYKKMYLKLSDEFIKWYNVKYKERKVKDNLSKLLDKGILGTYIVRDGKIFKTNSSRNSYYGDDMEGTKLFTFKGKDVVLHIDHSSNTIKGLLLLSSKAVSYILSKILLVINLNYGKDKTNKDSKEFYYI